MSVTTSPTEVIRPGCGCVLELRNRRWRRVRACAGTQCRAQAAAKRGPYARRRP